MGHIFPISKFGLWIADLAKSDFFLFPNPKSEFLNPKSNEAVPNLAILIKSNREL